MVNHTIIAAMWFLNWIITKNQFKRAIYLFFVRSDAAVFPGIVVLAASEKLIPHLTGCVNYCSHIILFSQAWALAWQDWEEINRVWMYWPFSVSGRVRLQFVENASTAQPLLYMSDQIILAESPAPLYLPHYCF